MGKILVVFVLVFSVVRVMSEEGMKAGYLQENKNKLIKGGDSGDYKPGPFNCIGEINCY